MKLAASLTAACIMFAVSTTVANAEELPPQARAVLDKVSGRAGECVHIAPARPKGRLAIVSANAGYRKGVP